MPFYVGIDIGSTSAKHIVLDCDKNIVHKGLMPTGWNSINTSRKIKEEIIGAGFDISDMVCVATGYGRVSVPYADKAVTEISCHAKGAVHIFGEKDCLVIDIGGQDTKVISIVGGAVSDFVMNDKCSAGTGRFLEVMSATMGVTIDKLCELAKNGSGVSITSMCTVFAESEVISLIGSSAKINDIAYGVLDSIANKVISQGGKMMSSSSRIYLTGGLCDIDYIIEALSIKFGKPVKSNTLGRYAGAIGAAITASTLKKGCVV